MIDWWRLKMSIFGVILMGGLAALLIFAPKVLVIFGGVSLVCIIVCVLIFIFYKILGD